VDEWIGPYRVINPYLGRGGQALLVEAERNGKSYVLKLLNDPHDPEASARFEQEISLLEAVTHPNIVRYVDDGVYEQTRYIALEKLAGYNLRFALADVRRFDPVVAADIGRQVTRALQVFHQLGAVHRDVKPENVQIDMSSGQVWLLDFGYARHVKRTRISNPGGDPPGTDGYRAPEMLQGYAYKQSDFFSLGVVLYELMSGRHPYGGDDPTRAHRVVPVNQLLPGCPKFLVNAIGFLLAWDVRNRPQTAAEVLDLLEDPLRGFRMIKKNTRSWMAPGILPVLFRLDAQSVSPLEQAEVNDVRPDAYLGAGVRSPTSTGEARVLAGDILVAPNST
jgi:serine/threonine protein kinase, bacterial